MKLKSIEEKEQWIKEKKAERDTRDDVGVSSDTVRESLMIFQHAKAVKAFITAYLEGLVTQKAVTADARIMMYVAGTIV